MHGQTLSEPQCSFQTTVMMVMMMTKMVMTMMINEGYYRLNFDQEDSVIKCTCLPLFQGGMC